MSQGVISSINAKILVGQVVPGAGGAPDTYPKPAEPPAVQNTAFVTVSDCAAWEISDTGEVKSYRSCNTGGYKKKILGGRDFKGTLKYFFNESDPFYDSFRAGTKVMLLLYLDQSANPGNVSGTPEDLFYACPAILTDVKVAANIDGGDTIGVDITFEGNGVLYYPGDAFPTAIPA